MGGQMKRTDITEEVRQEAAELVKQLAKMNADDPSRKEKQEQLQNIWRSVNDLNETFEQFCEIVEEAVEPD